MKKIFLAIILAGVLHSNAWAKEGIGTLISPGELAKAHSKYEGITNCTKCHKLGGGIPDSNCLDCHDKLAARIKNKEGLHAKFTGECISCHGDHKGRNYKMITIEKERFDHDRTDYRLVDKHAGVKCEKCHKKEGVYTGASRECLSCHDDYHKKQLSSDCANCHNFKGWKDIVRFNHNTSSRYALIAKHADVKCEKCHPGSKYKPIEHAKCVDCHKDAHKKQFTGKTCESCHSTEDWKKTSFDHNSTAYKGYKLEGKHIKTPCEKCHADGRYKPITADCFNCHKNDDTHKEELGRTCDRCHTPEDWKKTTLDHNLKTKFPLLGKHRDTPCEKCHKGKKYRTKAERCVDCHEDKHKGEFKEECSSCHTQLDWQPRKFDHKKKTGVELSGAHNDVVCSNCHGEKKDFRGANRYCNQCHTDPHLNQFGALECSRCHGQNSWNTALFRHGSTGFPLTGAHLNVECAECHKNRVYRNTSTACVICHLDRYNSATNHVSGGYPLDCTVCHKITSGGWMTINHANITTGCATCHLSYSNPPRPASHSTNGWTVCENCHRYATGWTY
ncbi:MAG: hypothetical protein HY883_07430, partial [Deltaproteobacteria bacterium]|nr:hypothetical protein [Deltaproteobacteria bacterium]